MTVRARIPVMKVVVQVVIRTEVVEVVDFVAQLYLSYCFFFQSGYYCGGR